MRKKSANYQKNKQNRLKNKLYFQRYSQFYYLKKILEDPEYNKKKYLQSKVNKIISKSEEKNCESR